MKIKLPELTELQKEYLPAIEWLVDDTQRYALEGRTFILAYVYIKMALEKQGKWIKINDHWPFLQGRDHLMQMIHRMISGMKITHRNPFINTEDQNLLDFTEIKKDQFRIIIK